MLEDENEKTSNYHKMRDFKEIDHYINYYNDIGIQEFIESLRVSGTLINPYDLQENNGKLINGKRNHFSKKIDLINEKIKND
ncbi:MAG: hypothetical protein K2K17_01045 [Lachnospiraceae bacterium]|nr:hypothetical protein [Lachnospiraceae bacterium]